MAVPGFRGLGIAALAIAVAGCTTAGSAPPPSSPAASYRATGNEPFWAIALTGQTIVMARPDAEDLTVPTPVARPTVNGRRYETAQITVDISRQRCQDSMSGAAFSDRVLVLMPDKTSLDGCGGDRLPPAAIAATQWILVDINGKTMVDPPVSGKAPTLDIALDGSISGHGGCNRYRGGPRFNPDGRVVSGPPIASTRMACPEPAGGVNETHFLGLLEKANGWRFEGGMLLVTTTDGQQMNLRQAF